MKRALTFILTICLIITNLPYAVYAIDSTPEIPLEEFADKLSDMQEKYEDEPVSNRLIVKSKYDINELDSVDIVEGYDDLHIVQFDNSESVEKALEYYENNNRVEYAEADMTVSALEAGSIHYDNHLSWGSETIGVDDYIDYLDNISDLPEIVVGVIDTGVDIDHEFLQGRVIETGFNLSDTGFTDSEEDDNGHGTHVAGIIADNTTDNVKIKAFKCLNANGSGSLFDVCLAVEAAAEQNVNVINMSLGSKGKSLLLEEYIENAISNGITVCVAAGNNGDYASNYTPASISNCITVGAINSDEQKPLWSNFGEAIDVYAPGSAIYSTYMNNSYKELSGTSMACPFVAASAALLISNDTTIRPNEITDLIINNSRQLNETFLNYVLNVVYIGELSNFKYERTSRPEFSIESGTFLESMYVEITCQDENVEIYYTTDGSRASQSNGVLYTQPILIDKVTNLNACAYSQGKLKSLQSSSKYNIVTKDPDNNYDIDDNGIITAYYGDNQFLSIQEQINNINVTGIGESVFQNSNLEIIVLPNSVTHIYKLAFKNCTNLCSVYADSIINVDEEAFSKCEKLSKIDISNLETVGKYAFLRNKGIEAIFNNTLINIGYGAFEDCQGLLYADFPSVITLENKAFQNCVILETLNLPKVETVGASSFEGLRSIKELNFPKLELLSGASTFAWCDSLTEIRLPSLAGEIPERTFETCNKLREISLYQATIIGKNAFAYCYELEIVYLPNVTEIETKAFQSTRNIQLLFIPSVITVNSLPNNLNTTIFFSDKYVSDKSGVSSVNYSNFTIVSPLNSFAYDWAEENGCDYINSDNMTNALGGTIRLSDSGLRFGFSWDNIAELENIADNVEYGFLYEYGETTELSRKKVATNRIDHDGYTTFNLVFTNIPKANYDTKISARAYVCIDGMYFYSNIITRSFEGVANAVLSDNTIDEATKEQVRTILEA